MGKKAKGTAASAATTSKETAAPASSAATMTKKGAAAPPPNTAMSEMKSGKWTKSTFKPKDLQALRDSGLVSASHDDVKFPGDKVIPRLDASFIRGLSLPAYEFLRGLLFEYGIQLYQLTPNAILHIACYITVCECFLGIHPHWGLWRYMYTVKRQGS
jgi:hypothetical protein